MSYRATNAGHVESLHDGRMIVVGDTVSDADAKKNPRLVERGVLEKEPDQRKQQRKAHVPLRETVGGGNRQGGFQRIY